MLLAMHQRYPQRLHQASLRFFAQVVLSILCVVFAADTIAAVDEAAVERLLRRSGMWNQADALATAVTSGFGEAHLQPGSTLSEQDGKRLGQLAGRVFTGAALRTEVLRSVAATLTPEDVKAAEAWYSSSLGRRITLLEERATSEQADLATTKSRAATAMAKASNPVLTVDFQAVRTQLAKQLAPVLAELRTDTPKLFALTYASLKDDELKAYIEFNRTKAAGKFNSAVIDGMDRAFVQLSLKLGEDYARSTEQKRGT